MTTEAPRNLRYDSKDSERYDRLTKDELSPFQGAPFKDLFVYAATYGFRYRLSEDLEKPRPNIPLTALNDEDIWILKAIAIAETQSLDILNNEKEAYQIAEKYANGALEEIYLEVLGGKPGEPYKRMMQDVLEEFEQISCNHWIKGRADGK